MTETRYLNIGLTSIGWNKNSFPENIARIARCAEQAGFDSLWAGGHTIIENHSSSIQPHTRMLDPIVALTFIAAMTTHIRLATGIIVLPQYNPLILAKELASLDVLSNGRLIFGVGIGWAESEFDALGVPFDERKSRFCEYLQAMQTVWSDASPGFTGRHVAFSGIKAYPHPVQQPHPPVVMGGNSRAALQRAIELAHGWYGWHLDHVAATAHIRRLHEMEETMLRPPSLGEIEISISAPLPIDRADAERYAAAGVHRIVLIPPGEIEPTELETEILKTSEYIVGRIIL